MTAKTEPESHAVQIPSRETSPTPEWPIYQNGDRGPDVTTIQYLLRVVTVDGIFGPQTEGAVRGFQQAHSLQVDGVVGPETWPVLILQVRRGDTGDAVKAAQEQLNQYDAGLEVDGVFGPLTDAATRRFQTDHGLEDDGIIGPLTWQALVTGRGTPPPPPPPPPGYSLPLPRDAVSCEEYGKPHWNETRAVDLIVPEGTDVYAIKGGTATQNVDSDGCGNYYAVEADDGARYLYCHLSEFVVGDGVRVETGALLGKSGDTGASGKPHLHIQLEAGDPRTWRCPQPLLLAICDGVEVPDPASLPTEGCTP